MTCNSIVFSVADGNVDASGAPLAQIPFRIATLASSGSIVIDSGLPQNDFVSYNLAVTASDEAHAALSTTVTLPVRVQPFLRCDSSGSVVANWLLSYPRPKGYSQHILAQKHAFLNTTVSTPFEYEIVHSTTRSRFCDSLSQKI